MTTELTASYGTVEGRKQKLMTDLRGVVADVDDLAKEVAGLTAEEFAVARTKIEARLGEARSRLDDARIALKERARGAANSAHQYARENPWRAVGVSAAAGLIVGLLLRHR